MERRTNGRNAGFLISSIEICIHFYWCEMCMKMIWMMMIVMTIQRRRRQEHNRHLDAGRSNESKSPWFILHSFFGLNPYSDRHPSSCPWNILGSGKQKRGNFNRRMFATALRLAAAYFSHRKIVNWAWIKYLKSKCWYNSWKTLEVSTTLGFIIKAEYS